MLVIVIIVVIVLLLLRSYTKSLHVDCDSKRRLVGKTCVVTGGTSGMGLETAKDFARRGARVIIACPVPQEGLDAQATIIKDTGNQNVVFRHLDLSSLQSTRDFAQNILQTEERLDILINNAGMGTINDLSKDGLHYTMQVNYYGHFLLTYILLPLLKKSGTPEDKSRIVNTSSVMYIFGRYETGSMNNTDIRAKYQTYPNSKLCLILFALELARRLKGSNVIVNSVDPGAVGTRNLFILNFGYLGGLCVTYLFSFLFKTPQQGAQTIIYAALDENVNDISGRLIRNCKVVDVREFAADTDAAEKLWKESIKLVKLETSEEI